MELGELKDTAISINFSCMIGASAAQVQVLLNLTNYCHFSITKHDKILDFHYFESVDSAH